MELIYTNIESFFNRILHDLDCQDDTKAYIISIYSKYKSADFDLSKENITLTFIQAKTKHDFLTYQNLGDWIFFTKSAYPEHLSRASEDYYYDIGSLSYHSCYNLINRQWQLFNELATNFIPLEQQTRNILRQHIKSF